MKKNMIFALVVSLAFPLVSSAMNLKLTNESTHIVSVKMNNICMDQTLVSKFEVEYPESLLKNYCAGKADNCVAAIYKSQNCSGKAIVKFTLSAEKGWSDTIYHDMKYYTWTIYPDSAGFGEMDNL